MVPPLATSLATSTGSPTAHTASSQVLSIASSKLAPLNLEFSSRADRLTLTGAGNETHSLRPNADRGSSA